MKYIALLLMLTCVFGSFGQKESSGLLSEENTAKIETALHALLKSENPNSFVIFEEPITKKYVQFSGGRYYDDSVYMHELFFSLPQLQMTDSETEIANKLLSPFGIKSEEMGSWGKDFIKNMKSDVDEATQTVSIVMCKVFGFKPDVKFRVIENM